MQAFFYIIFFLRHLDSLKFFFKAGREAPSPAQEIVVNKFCCHKFYPPIITVGHPAAIVPPCAVLSPCRAAGCPPINTVADPLLMVSGGPVQVSISPTFAAG